MAPSYGGHTPSYLVETYAPLLGEAELAEVIRRAELAGEALRRQGIVVEHLRSYLVREDEMCLHVFEGPTASAIGRAAGQAGVDFERIVETVADGGGLRSADTNSPGGGLQDDNEATPAPNQQEKGLRS